MHSHITLPFSGTLSKFPLRAGVLVGALAIASSCSHDNHPLIPQGMMDSPTNGSVVPKSVSVAGWALSEDGVASVAVYLDRRYRANADLNGARPDVKGAFPQFPDAGTSGFSTTLALDNVAAGQHLLEVEIRSKTGGVLTREANIVLK